MRELPGEDAWENEARIDRKNWEGKKRAGVASNSGIIELSRVAQNESSQRREEEKKRSPGGGVHKRRKREERKFD